MDTSQIFSKMKVKNPKNVLEEVLETKNFSEDVKSLLLSMLYKIDIGYEDYKTVKVYSKSKKEFMSEIISGISSDCNSIKFLDDKRKNNNSNDILVQHNEKSLLYNIANASIKGFYVQDKYELIKRFF